MGKSFDGDRKNRGPVSQQAWFDGIHPCSRSISVEHSVKYLKSHGVQQNHISKDNLSVKDLDLSYIFTASRSLLYLCASLADYLSAQYNHQASKDLFRLKQVFSAEEINRTDLWGAQIWTEKLKFCQCCLIYPYQVK